MAVGFAALLTVSICFTSQSTEEEARFLSEHYVVLGGEVAWVDRRGQRKFSIPLRDKIIVGKAGLVATANSEGEVELWSGQGEVLSTFSVGPSMELALGTTSLAVWPASDLPTIPFGIDFYDSRGMKQSTLVMAGNQFQNVVAQPSGNWTVMSMDLRGANELICLNPVGEVIWRKSVMEQFVSCLQPAESELAYLVTGSSLASSTIEQLDMSGQSMQKTIVPRSTHIDWSNESRTVLVAGPGHATAVNVGGDVVWRATAPGMQPAPGDSLCVSNKGNQVATLWKHQAAQSGNGRLELRVQAISNGETQVSRGVEATTRDLPIDIGFDGKTVCLTSRNGQWFEEVAQ